MSENLFAGRTALVTGGGRGIGRAVCAMLAQNGARVAINYQHDERAARQSLQQVEAAGAQGLLVPADVSQAGEVERMVGAVRERFGAVELLVNNAAITAMAEHDELDFDDWKRMFEVNVDGPFLTTWAVKDEMVAGGYGRIVNISSLAAILLKKSMIHYATTKAAVIAFTRHCAEALAPHNIRVNCLAPGLTDTDMAQGAGSVLVEQLIAGTPMGRMAAPGEMATVVKFLLGEDSSFVTGQTIVACGGRS